MNGQLYIYKQIDGVSVGSPLGPTLADTLMAAFEEEIFQSLISTDTLR